MTISGKSHCLFLPLTTFLDSNSGHSSSENNPQRLEFSKNKVKRFSIDLCKKVLKTMIRRSFKLLIMKL